MAAILSIYDLHRYSFREWSLTPADGGRGYYAGLGDNQGQDYGGGGGGEVDTGMQGIILLELETSG